ncbi:hypothetical protein ACFL2U_04000 [Patescibacteria group bacterium]
MSGQKIKEVCFRCKTQGIATQIPNTGELEKEWVETEHDSVTGEIFHWPKSLYSYKYEFICERCGFWHTWRQ